MGEESQTVNNTLTDSQILAVKDKVSEELKNAWSLVRGVLTFLGIANFGVVITLFIFIYRQATQQIEDQLNIQVENSVNSAVKLEMAKTPQQLIEKLFDPEYISDTLLNIGSLQTNLERAEETVKLLENKVSVLQRNDLVEVSTDISAFINAFGEDPELPTLTYKINDYGIRVEALEAKNALFESRIAKLEQGLSSVVGWTPLKLESGWMLYDKDASRAPSYMRDRLGFVHLRGVGRIEKNNRHNSPLAVLDEGFRPSRIYEVKVPCGGHTCALIINPDGRIYFTFESGTDDLTNSSYTIDNVIFLAEPR